MFNKIISNLSYWLCACLGFSYFIIMAFPYMKDYRYYGERTIVYKISGYQTMGLFDSNFVGVILSIVQIICCLFAVAMLAYGVCGILKSFGVIPQFLSKQYGAIALYVYLGLNAFLYVIISIFRVLLTAGVFDDNYYNVNMGVGVYLTLGSAIVATILYKYVQKNADITEEDEVAPKATYVCSKCGKKVKKDVHFCPDCGSSVEKRECVDNHATCSKCGKRVKKNVHFCPDCGGKVEQKTLVRSFVCEKCGKEGLENTFCAHCGSTIVMKICAPKAEDTTAVETEETPPPVSSDNPFEL